MRKVSVKLGTIIYLVKISIQ